MAKDYYAILAVDRNATVDQIKKRFRELARQRHPDLFSGQDKDKAEREFQEITEAFNILVDAERRRRHDLELSSPESRQTGPDSLQLAKVYLRRGTKSFREKNYLEAAENFDRATKSEPNNAQAWYYLALACSHQRRWLSRAMNAIAKACDLEPMNTTYLKLAGRLFAQGGRFLRAEQFFRQALQWGGDDTQVQVQRALEELKKAAKKSKSGLFGKAGG